MTLKCHFRRGGGVQFKKHSVGGVWIFSGTTQCNKNQQNEKHYAAMIYI